MSVEKAGTDGETWSSDDEPEADESRGALMAAVNEFVQERLNLRPPKRNNLKKKRDASAQLCAVVCPEDESMACPDCGHVGAYHGDARRDELACEHCGRVAKVGPVAGAAPDDGGPRCVVDARVNYFRERLSQWCNREPPIPPSGVRALIAAYDRCRDGTGPFRVSDVLSKPEIRAIVIEAGLRPKNCVEKWLTIRAMLLKHAGLPDEREQPTQSVVSECMNLFSTFLAAWDAHPELHDGRTSLPNYNFLIVSFLLQISAHWYETQAMWFPQVTQNKRERLERMFDAFCDIIGWPRYRAAVDAYGKVHRVRQATLNAK
jgi:hypothetical protein